MPSQRIVFLPQTAQQRISRIFEFFQIALAKFVQIGNRKTIISIRLITSLRSVGLRRVSGNSLLPRLSVITHACHLSLQMPDEPYLSMLTPGQLFINQRTIPVDITVVA